MEANSMLPNFIHKLAGRPFVALAMLGLVAFQNAPATAQAPPAGGGYKTLPMIASLATNKSNQNKAYSQIRSILNSLAPLGDNKVYFDAYYQQFFFPQMTLTAQDKLDDLPKSREKFLRDHLDYCKSQAIHDHLLALTIGTLLPVVQDPGFHPAVRYNAMLIIGALNAQEAVRLGSEKSVPVPYAPALSIMLTEMKNPKTNDAIRVASLIGIVRHLEWDNALDNGSQIAPLVRTDLLATLTALAAQKDSPPGRTAEGHSWLRRRAIEALALAGSRRAEASSVAAIDKILGDDSDVLAVRCAAAAAMGRMNYLPPVKIDPTEVTKKLGYLTLVICHSEFTRLADMKHTEELRLGPQMQQYGEGGSGTPSPYRSAESSIGSLGGGMGELGSLKPADPKAYRRDPICRRIRARIYSVQIGLNGPSKLFIPEGATLGIANYAKTPAEVKYVADVTAGITSLVKIVETHDYELATIEKDLNLVIPGLEAITKKLTPVAAPAGDDLNPDLPSAPAARSAPPSAPAAGSGVAGPGDDIPAAPAAAVPAAAAPVPAAQPKPPAVNPLDVPPR
jgi:hypothetical protein